MFATDDTIVAIATPSGRGALGLIRLSGPCAAEITMRFLEREEPLRPRHATFTRVISDSESPRSLDEVVAILFAAPHSYTGEQMVEITAHGSPVVLRTILRRAVESGARLAEPGEFTLRAFLSGKRDLIQSEAVADLIDAATPLQARVAFDQLEGTLTKRIASIDAELFDLIARLEASLDFPDEGYHFVEPSRAVDEIVGIAASINDLLAHAAVGRIIREGATVVIAGRPNVGKSSVFNVLAGSNRAIVTPVPGTTRDLVTETIDVAGIAVSLVDTAGWRDTDDVVEREGVERGTQARRIADLTLLVLDASEMMTRQDAHLLEQTATAKRIAVLNKSDLAQQLHYRQIDGPMVQVSALRDEGFDALRHLMAGQLTAGEQLRDVAPISNMRHIALLEQCRDSLAAARQAAEADHVSEEFLLTYLQSARQRLDEIVGRRTSADVLHHIFERFCIGK